jgi:hypothetical protein
MRLRRSLYRWLHSCFLKNWRADPASRKPLPAASAWSYGSAMTQADHSSEPDAAPPSRMGIMLLAGGAFALLLTGLLLWWREGDRLFTDGLIASIVACF